MKKTKKQTAVTNFTHIITLVFFMQSIVTLCLCLRQMSMGKRRVKFTLKKIKFVIFWVDDFTLQNLNTYLKKQTTSTTNNTLT